MKRKIMVIILAISIVLSLSFMVGAAADTNVLNELMVYNGHEFKVASSEYKSNLEWDYGINYDIYAGEKASAYIRDLFLTEPGGIFDEALSFVNEYLVTDGGTDNDVMATCYHPNRDFRVYRNVFFHGSKPCYFLRYLVDVCKDCSSWTAVYSSTYHEVNPCYC